MRLTKITNTSKDIVTINLSGGTSVGLPPNATLENADVDNLENIKGKTTFVKDLTEVITSSGKARLYD